jgi:hypothetical protein
MSGATDKCETLGSRPAAASSDDERLRRSEEDRQADVRRLTARLKGRDRQIEVLERVLVRTVVMHNVWAAHLERRLDRKSSRVVTSRQDYPVVQRDKENHNGENGLTVHLPHMTHTLAVLFDVMWTYWSAWDPERPPKSSTVARAIDEKLGLKGQTNGEASRSAQTFAAALRPDSVNQADGRHR